MTDQSRRCAVKDGMDKENRRQRMPENGVMDGEEDRVPGRANDSGWP